MFRVILKYVWHAFFALLYSCNYENTVYPVDLMSWGISDSLHARIICFTLAFLASLLAAYKSNTRAYGGKISIFILGSYFLSYPIFHAKNEDVILYVVKTSLPSVVVLFLLNWWSIIRQKLKGSIGEKSNVSNENVLEE